MLSGARLWYLPSPGVPVALQAGPETPNSLAGYPRIEAGCNRESAYGGVMAWAQPKARNRVCGFLEVNAATTPNGGGA